MGNAHTGRCLAEVADTPITGGAVNSCDTASFVATCRVHGVTPTAEKNDILIELSLIQSWESYLVDYCAAQDSNWRETPAGPSGPRLFEGTGRGGDFT